MIQTHSTPDEIKIRQRDVHYCCLYPLGGITVDSGLLGPGAFLLILWPDRTARARANAWSCVGGLKTFILPGCGSSTTILETSRRGQRAVGVYWLVMSIRILNTPHFTCGTQIQCSGNEVLKFTWVGGFFLWLSLVEAVRLAALGAYHHFKMILDGNYGPSVSSSMYMRLRSLRRKFWS